MEESIFDKVWNSFEENPTGVRLELFNFLRRKFSNEFQSWSAEKIYLFICNYKSLYKAHCINHKEWRLDSKETSLISTVCYKFNEHIRNLVPKNQRKN